MEIEVEQGAIFVERVSVLLRTQDAVFLSISTRAKRAEVLSAHADGDGDGEEEDLVATVLLTAGDETTGGEATSTPTSIRVRNPFSERSNIDRSCTVVKRSSCRVFTSGGRYTVEAVIVRAPWGAIEDGAQDWYADAPDGPGESSVDAEVVEGEAASPEAPSEPSEPYVHLIYGCLYDKCHKRADPEMLVTQIPLEVARQMAVRCALCDTIRTVDTVPVLGELCPDGVSRWGWGGK